MRMISLSRTILSAPLIGLLALGLVSCNSPAADDGSPESGTEIEGTTSNQFTGGVTDLMKNGKDVTCTFTRNDEAGTMNGTVFVARDGRMRGEFQMENPQFGSITMQVIRDGAYGYTWGFPSDTQGTKVELDDSGKPVKENDKAGIDDPMEYRCAPWRVDVSKFVPPASVQFQDLSVQMRQIEDAMGDIQAKQCGACDQVPAGASRDQCRASLGCK